VKVTEGMFDAAIDPTMFEAWIFVRIPPFEDAKFESVALED
jgi:hypothetical protein